MPAVEYDSDASAPRSRSQWIVGAVVAAVVLLVLTRGVVTLLLLPILQATQNRDGAALQAKIDELIKSNTEARDALIGLENRSEDEIERVRRGEEC